MVGETSVSDSITGEWTTVHKLFDEIEPTLPRTGQPNAIAKIRNALMRSRLDDEVLRWIDKNIERGILPYNPGGASRLRAALVEASPDFKRIDREARGRASRVGRCAHCYYRGGDV